MIDNPESSAERKSIDRFLGLVERDQTEKD